MIKILYITSTLQRSGPTNQLLNVVKYLDRNQFEPSLVTLSPEPGDSRWHDVTGCGVSVQSLELSRLSGVFLARRRFHEVLRKVQPDLIHTQGIRPDLLIRRMTLGCPIVSTIHNYAYDDYPAKYGRLLGGWMARRHFRAMRRPGSLVACSNTLQGRLEKAEFVCQAIQNGVDTALVEVNNALWSKDLSRPIFITVGSLIARKNMSDVVAAFGKYQQALRGGSLVVVGDGPLKETLRAQAGEHVLFTGNVSNVDDYLASADYFVSASRSEGLPNTVLEALRSGLPLVLSDINSHKEIATQASDACRLYSLAGGADALADAMSCAVKKFDESAVTAARRAGEFFSAERMSSQYQVFYKKILGQT